MVRGRQLVREMVRIVVLGIVEPDNGMGAQIGGGFCGSLLERAGVVVLVAGQGGAAGEGLLTIGIRALVRALSRVNAAMAG